MLEAGVSLRHEFPAKTGVTTRDCNLGWPIRLDDPSHRYPELGVLCSLQLERVTLGVYVYRRQSCETGYPSLNGDCVMESLPSCQTVE